jgi:hypothetical protein
MRLSNPLKRRLEELEAALLPKGRLFVMDVDIDDPDYEAKVAVALASCQSRPPCRMARPVDYA